MLNECKFIGHLGADPETRTFQNGGKVCNLRLAVTEKWTKDGEKKEKTEWITVAIFNDGLAGVAERYLKKGSKVFISGKFTTRKWQDQSGQDRYSSEIVLQGYDAKLVMLDGPNGGSQGSTGGGYGQPPDSGAGGGPSNYDDGGDSIPFTHEWRV